MEKGKSPTHMLEGGDSGRVMAGMVNGKEALLASMCFVAANSHKGATVAELWWRVAAIHQWKKVKKKSKGKVKAEEAYGRN